MRAELFYNPLALLERLGEWAVTRRRLGRLGAGVAAQLHDCHIDTLELLDLLKPLRPRVIYDIGANVGTWTLLAKAIFSDAQIHAFEPLPEHLEKFSRMTANLNGIALHEIALGSVNGGVEINVTDFSDASSVLPLTDEGRTLWSLSTVAKVPVTQRQLDDLVETCVIPWPDILKLDVQGYELEVLRGAPTVLAHAKAVIAEVSFHEYYEGQCRFDELVSFLAHHRFFVHAFGRRTRVGQQLVQADVLFTKVGLKPR